MLLEGLKKETNYKLTENGGNTHKTSNSCVLDYFAQGSALRNRDVSSICDLFDKSFFEDNLLSMKALFYSRDIREGQGERRGFRIIVKHLANTYPEVIRENIYLIPEFGRWDDLLVLFGTEVENDVLELIKQQYLADIKAEHPSLMAKWLPSASTKNQEKREIAYKIAKYLGISIKWYRKNLSMLRKRLDIVERKITQKNYNDIDYSKVPSYASLMYKNTFYKRDRERYQAYIDSLDRGETKVNTKTLYPYQIIEKIFEECINKTEEKLLNSMWSNLPDYVEDNYENCLAVIDTSGSMWGIPINIAVSLGLYFAERNKGEFANHFITFSSAPKLVNIKGNTLSEKARFIRDYNEWGWSTNIEAVFDLILNTAKKYKMSQSEMPSRIIIFSDMEFNGVTTNKTQTVFDSLKERYEIAGYNLPKLIFWNVNSRQDNIPMTMEDNVQLVSGASPVVFEAVLKGEFLSAYDLMLSVINKERYDCVTV